MSQQTFIQTDLERCLRRATPTLDINNASQRIGIAGYCQI